MKLAKLILIPLTLLLVSCGGTTNDTTTTEDGSPDITFISDEESYEKISYITLDKREIYVEINKRSDSLLVSYYPNNDLSLDDKEVTWSSNDESIATIDAYGRVSGVSLGDTIVKCVTKIDSRHATCVVHVVESIQDIAKEYRLVDDVTSLEAGDIIVIAAPKFGVVASLDTLHMQMHVTETVFNEDDSAILELGDDAAEFILDGETNNFTLENQEGKYLATTNEKKVTFVNAKGNIHWAFSEDNGLYIESTSAVPGWIMYNVNTEVFATYESNEQVDLVFPTIYRLEII